VFVLAFVLALVTDSCTKAAAVRALAPGRAVPDDVRTPVRLRRTEHTLHLRNRRVVVACWVALLVGAGVLAFVVFAGEVLVKCGLGLAAGGATGNVLDHLRGRAIVDFVELRGWPIFNVADAAITVGVLLTIVGLV
jgi:lipoprotein signal peptidase